MPEPIKSFQSSYAPPDREEIHFYPCEYTWHDATLGELTGSAVITGIDAEAALRHFRSRQRHVTHARILNKTP